MTEQRKTGHEHARTAPEAVSEIIEVEGDAATETAQPVGREHRKDAPHSAHDRQHAEHGEQPHGHTRPEKHTNR